MTDRALVKANAEYTGGGIYVFASEYSDGTYGMAATEDENIYIVDAFPDAEYAWYNEWMDEHIVETISGDDYIDGWLDILLYITKNEPTGNYSILDIERYIREASEGRCLVYGTDSRFKYSTEDVDEADMDIERDGGYIIYDGRIISSYGMPSETKSGGRTKRALDRLTETQLDYLRRIAKADNIDRTEKIAHAKGYFKALKDVNAIEGKDEQILFNWFTVVMD